MSTLFLLCRFCAKEQPEQSLIDLKTDKIQRHSIMQKLFIFSEGIIDFTNICLPETVCTACYSILDISYKFFVQVQESQIFLSRFCSDVEIVEKGSKETTGLVKKEFVSLGFNSDEKCIGNSDSSEIEDTPSWSTYPWCCTHCNITLASMQAVREHSQENHKTCYGFQCADCDEKMDTFEDFVKHVVRKRGELAKYCEYCNVKMESPTHRETHTSDHNCTYCGQIFNNETSLLAHLKKYVTKDAGLLRFNMEICEDSQYKSDDTMYLNDTDDTSYSNDFKGIVKDKLCQNDTSLINDTLYQNDTIHTIDDTAYRIDSNTDSIDKVTLNKTTRRMKHTINLTDYTSNMLNCKTVNDTKIQSWSQYPRICKFCNIKVAYTDMLKEHCMLIHQRCFGMKCVDCEYDAMDTFEQFVQHVRTHRPYLKNICHYCDSKMSGFDVFHVQAHIGRYHCSVCGENFHRSRDLRKHDNKLESPALKPPVQRRRGPITDKDVTCNVCGKRMKTPLSLRAHKVIHTDRKRNHTCDRCGKAFFTKASMEAHHKIHEDIEKETCKICEKSFLTVQRLRKHVKTHNLEMPFQCDDCKKLFSSKDSLRAHVTVHMNIKPYECQYCSKRFRNKHTMKTHENQHTGARPYSCDVCCINFACWSNCDKHMRRIHGTPLAKTVKTPHGKLAIDPETGKPSDVSITSVVKEWSRNILEKSLRKCKR